MDSTIYKYYFYHQKSIKRKKEICFIIFLIGCNFFCLPLYEIKQISLRLSVFMEKEIP